MAEGDEDHGSVTMTPAVTLGDIDQPVDLGATSPARQLFVLRWLAAPASEVF